jgi:conjugative transposon TraM protein
MLRHRKFLVVLPLLIIPFLTMAFWSLGGGKNAAANDVISPSGLNLELPGASLKEDKAIDKLGYYDRAAADSLKLQEQMKNDPYFIKNATAADSVLDAISFPKIPSSGTNMSYGSDYSDPNEAKVYEKLGQLNAAVKENTSTSRKTYARNSQPDYSVQTTDVERLEQMMATGGNTAPDPEMKQLNGMLEKILDIQHPERVKASLQKDAIPDGSLTVAKENSTATFSSFDTSRNDRGFFGLDHKAGGESSNAIEAVVHENQILVTGAIVKMRLLSDIVIGGHRICKGHFVYGIASLNKERLEITVSSIRDGESLFPVKLEVFDMDGLAGIYIPGAIGRDVAKQSSDNALQSVSLGTVDPSLGAQAASAGIETAKNLLSRKVKLIKVQVKAGYKILLKNNSK